MKRILKSSLLISAALLGVSSVGGVVASAATTVPPLTSTASADITPGTITLDSVPGVSFGSTTAGLPSNASDFTYTSTAIASDLHVSDPGNASGYSVTVADTPFTSSSTTSSTLKGAALSFTDAAAITADSKNNVSTAPTFTGSLPISATPAEVLNAPVGEGVGAYTAAYGATDASLFVPAGNIGGSYSSTLTWTLSNAPA